MLDSKVNYQEPRQELKEFKILGMMMLSVQCANEMQPSPQSTHSYEKVFVRP